jgi:S-adenosylmethionine/arginine decarboxylase-like enzyme
VRLKGGVREPKLSAVALKAAASEQKGASGVLVVCESLHIREPTHATSPVGKNMVVW